MEKKVTCKQFSQLLQRNKMFMEGKSKDFNRKRYFK